MLAYFGEAARVLLANRGRSILTIIGLIVGVAAIVSIQVSAKGMAGAVNGIFKGMSANTFYIFPKSTQGNSVRAALKFSDIALIEQNVPDIETAIPAGRTQTIVRAGHARVRLVFGGESDKRFSTAPLAAGRALDAADIANASTACVLSSNAYTRLFPNASDPAQVVGNSVYIGAKRYVVAGVFGKATVDTAALGLDVSNDVAIPYSTYYNTYLRGQSLFAVQVLGRDKANLAALEDRTKAVLATAHPGATYTAFDLGFFTKTINGFFTVIGLIVSAVGAISLVVAGIGIMNIMLVSVTERTREIGIRKAIGARRSQVLWQFFIEALLLSAAGCFIGMIIGLLLGDIADHSFISKISGVTAPLPWLEAVLIATGFSTFITLAFGTFPAFRAASLDPIEALRYE
ncbi:MAG: ABC transporter permease [Candidatus Eremiobacteraeota bacterium]|nr:ABC transporter permease [Candidatus Eremiobacteraeota bacterium]